MTDVWSERVELYVESEAHSRGEDLEQLVTAAGLEIREVALHEHTIDFRSLLERTSCVGTTAERVRELWADRVVGDRLTLYKIAILARKPS